MPIGFGFSVGDFIAVLELVWKLQEAFRDTTGSIDQYRTIVDAIGNYEHILITCRKFSSEWVAQLSAFKRADGSVDFSSGDQALVNGISYTLKKSHEGMDRFLKENKKYTDAFIKARVSHSMSVQWRKVRFIFKRDGVDRMYTLIEGYTSALQSYTLTLAMRVMMKTSNHINDNEKSMQLLVATEAGISQIHSLLLYLQKDFRSMMKIIENDIPNMMGYPWSRAGFSSNEKPIILHDALGRTIPLPFVLCATQTQFSLLMQVLFENLPGYGQICDEDFTLQRDKDGTIVKMEKWKQSLVAGESITMSVIMREVLYSPSESSPNSKGWKALKMDLTTYNCGRCSYERIPRTVFQCPKCFRDSKVIVEKSSLLPNTQPRKTPMSSLTFSERNYTPKINERERNILRNWETSSKWYTSKTSDKELQRITIIRKVLKLSRDRTSEYLESRDGFPLSGIQVFLLHFLAAAGAVHKVGRIIELLDGAVEELFESPEGFQPGVIFYMESMPLHLAAQIGASDIAALLLKRGADARENEEFSRFQESHPWPMFFDRNALNISIFNNNIDTAKVILNHSYNGKHMPVSGESRTNVEYPHEYRFWDIDRPILLASKDDNIDILELLLGSKCIFRKADMQYLPPLSWAIRCKSLRAVRRLVEAGRCVNGSDEPKSPSPLQLACHLGNHEEARAIVKYLLMQGADNRNITRVQSHTSLYSAFQEVARCGYMEIDLLETLVNVFPDEFQLELGCGVGQNDLFCLAVMFNHLSMVKFLIHKGADINETSCKEVSQLLERHYTRQYRYQNIEYVSNDHFLCPLSIALVTGSDDMVQLLLRHKPRLDGPGWRKNPFRDAAHPNLLIALLDAGIKPNIYCLGELTCIHELLSRKFLSALRKLISEGININTEFIEYGPLGGYSISPITYAIWKRETEVIEVLVAAGATNIPTLEEAQSIYETYIYCNDKIGCNTYT